MAQRLKNILNFIGLVPNVPTVLPHGLITSNGKRLTPDLILPSLEGATITADDVNVTVTVNATAIAVYCEAWHTVDRSFGDVNDEDLVPQPFVPFSGPGAEVQSFSNFVYRPGGVAGNTVYTSWPALMAALPLVQGYKTVQIDSSIVSPAVIPAGTYDLTDTELIGYRRLGFGPASLSIGGVASGGDVIFTGLSKIDGDITVTNNNTGVSPVAITVSGSVFEIGMGPHGDRPTISNALGAVAFFDCSGLPALGNWAPRLHALLTGASPCIQYGANVNAANCQPVLFDGADINAGMIAGTNPGNGTTTALLLPFLAGNSQFCRQNLWAGTITIRTPNSAGIPRAFMRPEQGAGQSNPVPSPVTFTTATGLAMGATLRYDTTGPIVIPQILPLIRAAAPASGASGTTTGVLESTGLEVTIKNELGTGTVSVTPAVGDTIDGGAGPIVLTAGQARTFRSNGVSNWSIVSGYL